eukprot:CAMPEP_0117673036 /NCGR_PEP_ID=MMETSP0804-20121206/14250_1 /TAXON_ID=1074897 /ORGANISM="Tetraselmis astigmatica, Strain CCMP880" /LENGTH=475 /DNA_ID=CAMNT_0005481731 /DNA_START=42 /DNA_END=1469 /DNA_ORIENTATION=-
MHATRQLSHGASCSGRTVLTQRLHCPPLDLPSTAARSPTNRLVSANAAGKLRDGAVFGLTLPKLPGLIGGRAEEDAVPEDPEALLSPSEKKALERKRFWGLWAALPIAPYSQRKTVLREVAKGKLYCLEQTQGLLNVIVNVRMVVVVLRNGGLWVHNPVAPTPELMEMMASLQEKHGAVRYIVLGSSQVEHKVFLGPFSRKFPNAEVHVPPKLWSWPLNLPLRWLGLFPRGAPTGIISDSFSSGQFPGEPSPWASEFEQAVLSLPLKVGYFTEVGFVHKPTRTLILTDALQYVTEDPPEVCPVDSLLIRARDGPGLVLEDSLRTRRQGWAKVVLFALYLQPAVVTAALFKNNSFLNIVDGFEWDPSWTQSFKSLKGKLFVPPILHTLIFNRSPEDVSAWGERLASWGPASILPAHLAGPVKTDARKIRSAFQAAFRPKGGPYRPGDISTLEAVDENLISNGLTLNPQVNNRMNDL